MSWVSQATWLLAGLYFCLVTLPKNNYSSEPTGMRDPIKKVQEQTLQYVLLIQVLKANSQQEKAAERDLRWLPYFYNSIKPVICTPRK